MALRGRARAQQTALARVDPALTIQERITEVASSHEALLDVRENLATLQVYRERLLENLARLDSPGFRERALEAFQKGDMPALEEILRRGCEAEGVWQRVLDISERSSVLQMKANELLLKRDGAMTVRQVVGAFQQILDIMAEEIADRNIRERLVTRITTEVMGRDVRMIVRQPRRAEEVVE